MEVEVANSFSYIPFVFFCFLFLAEESEFAMSTCLVDGKIEDH